MRYKQSWKEHNDMFAVLSSAEKKGIKKTQKEVVINAIKKGFDDQTIYELTNLPLSEITEIRKEFGL